MMFTGQKKPYKVLFVCHGNICRSPMAEFVFKKYVEDKGRADAFYIESAATSSEELGNPVYPPARKKLASVGIRCDGKCARRIRKEDYASFDLLIGMDEYNIVNMKRFYGSDSANKIRLFLSFAGEDRSIADPWYTGDFDITYEDVSVACVALFDYVAALFGDKK